MTVSEAHGIAREYYNISVPTEEDDFRFTEALSFLLEETKDPRCMMELGGWYYGRRNFDLALKYYEMAAEYEYPDSYNCLGYIWYYGRTGEKNFEKAFKYYSLAAETGDREAAYKVAEFFLVHYIIHGIMHLSKHLGRPEMVKKGNRIFKVIYTALAFEIIVLSIEIIFGKELGEEISAPFGIVANVLKMVENILLLIYIRKGNKILKSSNEEG